MILVIIALIENIKIDYVEKLYLTQKSNDFLLNV